MTQQTYTAPADIEALAEAWASIDGRLDKFRACKADQDLDRTDGYYIGYLSDAEELKRRLEARGFTIVKLASRP